MVDPREGMPRDCPGDETVAAYLDGTLGSAERRVLEAHLDRCPDCYDQFVETSRFLAQESRDVGVRPFSTGRRSALRRTTVPKVAAGLAAAAALATAGVLAYRSISPHRKSSMALLAEAAPKSRPFAGRVAGLPYAPLRELTRAGAPEGEASLSLLSAAAAIQEKAGATRRAEDFQALGAAQMLLERTAASLGTLEPLAKEHPSAEILSDLSAAYLERSRREDSAEDAARALSAAERALKQHPRLPEALFNRAASLDALGLADAAREAWESYLRADQSSGWADEARRRRDASTPRIPRGANAASDVEARIASWAQAETSRAPDADHRLGEIVLASREEAKRTGDRFHERAALHVESLDAKGRRDLAEALVILARARRFAGSDELQKAKGDAKECTRRFSELGSPYVLASSIQVAILQYYAEDLDGCLATLDSLTSAAASPSQPRANAKIGWIRALIQGRRGDLAASLAHYREVRNRLNEVHDEAGLGAVDGLVAETLWFLGERSEAWSERREAFRLLPSVDAAHAHNILYEAGVAALREGLDGAGVALARLDVRHVSTLAPAFRAEGAILATRAAFASNDTASARAAEGKARGEVDAVDDPSLHERLASELDALLVENAPRGDEPSMRRADHAIRYFERSEAHYRLSNLYAARARLLAAAGNREAAREDLQKGVAEVERQLPAQGDFGAGFFERSADLFVDLATLALERGAPAADVFDVFERGKARALLDAREIKTPIRSGDLAARIGEGAVLVEYAVLADRVLTFVVANGTVTSVSRPFSHVRLDDAVTALMPLAREPSPAGWESASADLFDALVRPVLDRLPSGATLIIVPDGPLALVPFGALRDRRSGRYLIEDHPVAVAPSATLAASFLADPARPTAPRHVLVSADPAAGQGVARLRDAREEASAVAACYPSAELLVGPNVRKADVLERLPGVDLWHFGGHAVVNREVPSLSRLLLGKTLQDSLFAQDVAGRHLDNLRVVVLATCEGAAGRVLRGEGVLNLARPFLAAGVKTVVAALWPVPDTSARPVFIMLHRALAEGLAPSAALQRAQVESIHTTNVAAWASLVSIGSPR